jgi:hypothetical protein
MLSKLLWVGWKVEALMGLPTFGRVVYDWKFF